MDERKVAKEALKKEYLKEIARELNKKHTGDISVSSDGILCLSASIRMNSNNALIDLVSELADLLANEKAELWVQTHLTESW